MRTLSTAMLCILVVLTGCDESEKIPNVYEVTTHFHRKVIPADQSETQTIQFSNPPGMAVRTDKVNMSVSDINVTAVRTEGNRVPPFTAFVSQTFLRDTDDLLQGFSGISGNLEWLRNRVGDLAVCTESLWLEHGSASFGYENADSTINLASTHTFNQPLVPVYRESGASYLTTFTQQTMHIPWIHPDVPDGAIPDVEAIGSEAMHVDMRMLSRVIFGALSGALTTAVGGMPTFSLTLPGGFQLPVVQVSLGGADGAGKFRLHYLPQMQYNEEGSVADNSNSPIRRAGIGFYFEGTIDLRDPLAGAVPVGSIRVIIPAFLDFDVVNAQGDIQVDFQPIADVARGEGANAMGMDKIVILTNTPLGIQANNVAESVRIGVQDALTAMASDGSATGLFVMSTLAFSSGVNKYRKRPAPGIDFDVVLVPDDCNQHDNPMCFQYNGLVSSQIQPETPGSTRISCFILGR